ncbi:MAG: heavy metal translocating P-type ATPase [Hyphomicrobiales bacterium]
MNCCDTSVELGQAFAAADAEAWARDAGDGRKRLDVIAPAIHCGACISTIERGLAAEPGIETARVNFTLRQVSVTYRPAEITADGVLAALERLGYPGRPFDPLEASTAVDDAEGARLLRAVAVAGFAAANIMLLSVSVWSGADGATRDLFHWISALIALPAVFYAGQPFFRGAVRALSRRSMSMDVPISLGVILATAMSLFETMRGGHHAYFDAAVTLLFFLLIGRYLDQLMRTRARSAVSQLMTLSAAGATVIEADGQTRYLRLRDLKAGMKVLVAAGERLPADGAIVEGASDIDRSLVTGETTPDQVGPGATVHAGTLNLTGPLVIDVTAVGEDTFLGEIIRLMTAAEQSKSTYVMLADRLARLYAPAVHVLAALTLVGWLIFTRGDWHASLMAAIAVLIITCPCALGLAVPAVQIVASGLLFRNGVMIRDGAGLEKLSEIDTVVFDKTGTLTLGSPKLVEPKLVSTETLALAAGLAVRSKHPLSRALVAEAEARGVVPFTLTDVREEPGAGLSGTWRSQSVRLGSRAWCGVGESEGLDRRDPLGEGLPELILRPASGAAVVFRFQDELRPDAAAVVAGFKAQGIGVELLSGDRHEAVRRVAESIGIATWRARWTPQAKLAYVEALGAAGRRVLMVGDGLNDAPALAAGYASMAPATASDIGRTAADVVFLGASLRPVLVARDIAVTTAQLARQNFALAIGYNVLAVPVAMLGFASPLVAAIAMSTSSLIVVGNALRLQAMPRFRRSVMAGPGTKTDTAAAVAAIGEKAA